MNNEHKNFNLGNELTDVSRRGFLNKLSSAGAFLGMAGMAGMGGLGGMAGMEGLDGMGEADGL